MRTRARFIATVVCLAALPVGVAAADTRHYRFAGRLNRAAINARVWSGLHFRTADVVGNHRAQHIARYVFHREFRP